MYIGTYLVNLSATLVCNTCLQRLFATLVCNACLQHLSATLVCNTYLQTVDCLLTYLEIYNTDNTLMSPEKPLLQPLSRRLYYKENHRAHWLN